MWATQSTNTLIGETYQNPLKGNETERAKVMEYNISKETALVVGDKLSDAARNKYVVVDLQWKNTHSQYASEVLLECYKGPRKGESKWVPHQFAIPHKEK